MVTRETGRTSLRTAACKYAVERAAASVITIPRLALRRRRAATRSTGSHTPPPHRAAVSATKGGRDDVVGHQCRQGCSHGHGRGTRPPSQAGLPPRPASPPPADPPIPTDPALYQKPLPPSCRCRRRRRCRRRCGPSRSSTCTVSRWGKERGDDTPPPVAAARGFADKLADTWEEKKKKGQKAHAMVSKRYREEKKRAKGKGPGGGAKKGVTGKHKSVYPAGDNDAHCQPTTTGGQQTPPPSYVGGTRLPGGSPPPCRADQCRRSSQREATATMDRSHARWS